MSVTEATRVLVDHLAAQAMQEVARRIEAQLEDLRRPDQALTRAEAMERCGVKKSQWAVLLRQGLVPAPNPHTGRYSEKDIETFIAGRWKP